MHGTTYRYQVRLAVNGLLDTDNIEYADPHITQKPIIAAYPAITRFI